MPLPQVHTGTESEDLRDRDFDLYRLLFSISPRSECRSSSIISERSASQWSCETSNVRTVGVIRPCSSTRGRSESMSPSVSNRGNSMVSNDNAMETARRAAKHIYQLHGNVSPMMIKEIMNACYYWQGVRWTTAKHWIIFSKCIRRLFTWKWLHLFKSRQLTLMNCDCRGLKCC